MANGGGGLAMAAGAVTQDRRTGQFATGSELTELQRAFVRAYVLNGGYQTKAAETAGYGDPGARAWELMRNPAVLAAIREEQARALYAEVGAASVKTVLEVMRDPGARNADKVQAARLGAEMAKLIKRDKKEEDNPLGNKPLSEMSEAQLVAFIAAGEAAAAALNGPRVIEGEAHETGDSAQDSARIIDAEPITP